MAITLNANTTAGAELLTNTVGGEEIQVVRITGGGTSETAAYSASNPFPVYLAGAHSLTLTFVITGAIGPLIPGTGATNLGKAEDGAHTSGDVGVMMLAVRQDTQADFGADGDYVPLSIDANGAVRVGVIGTVSLTGSMSVLLSGPVSLTGSVQITGITNTIEVVGDAAHDAAVAGNPLLMGFEARTTNPTAVADGDAVRAMADDLGRQIVVPNAPRDRVVNNHVSLSVSTTITLLAAGGAGVFRDLLMLTISNPAASAALVTIFDNHTTGTQKFKWELAADGGGVVLVFNTPFPAASANTGWGITSSETGVVATAQAVDTV